MKASPGDSTSAAPNVMESLAVSNADLDRFLSVVPEELNRDPGNLRFSFGQAFRDISFDDATVLDIGAGEGAASFYAASLGARKVVALEPEVAGSHPGMRERFERVRSALDAKQVQLRAETFQEFDPDAERFQILISLASINHLDEGSCSRLHRDPIARDRYRRLLRKLAAMAEPGASLVVCDCSRHNIFAHLGLRNPIVPTIEWHKHQSPRVWARLLESEGFAAPRIRWSSFNTLRGPGQVVLGNRFAAYLLTSVFCLTMKRA